MPYVLHEVAVKKVLYVDVDMLCVGDIGDLFKLSLDNHIAYVVKAFTREQEEMMKYCRLLGLKGYNYFNSGMLLINVTRYVAEDIGIKAVQLRNTGRYKYLDQDVLNILLEGKAIVDTSPVHNCTMSVRNEWFPRDGARLIHFTGGKKPWKAYTAYWGKHTGGMDDYSWKYAYYELWRKYAAESPWKDVPYAMPQTYSEWRYLAKSYYNSKEYKKAASAYLQYLRKKFSNA